MVSRKKVWRQQFQNCTWGCQWSSEAKVIAGGREENWDDPTRCTVYVGFEHPDPSSLGGMGSDLTPPAYTIGTFSG